MCCEVCCLVGWDVTLMSTCMRTRSNSYFKGQATFHNSVWLSIVGLLDRLPTTKLVIGLHCFEVNSFQILLTIPPSLQALIYLFVLSVEHSYIGPISWIGVRITSGNIIYVSFKSICPLLLFDLFCQILQSHATTRIISWLRWLKSNKLTHSIFRPTEFNLADALAKSDEIAQLLNFSEGDHAKINLLLGLQESLALDGYF